VVLEHPVAVGEVVAIVDNIGRLALSFEDDEVPDRETLAAGLDWVAVIEIELADGGG
jgi:hypothetical protein